MSVNAIAYFIGYTVLILGGSVLSVLILILLGWATFDAISKRVGWTKRILEWRDAAIRERSAG